MAPTLRWLWAAQGVRWVVVAAQREEMPHSLGRRGAVALAAVAAVATPPEPPVAVALAASLVAAVAAVVPPGRATRQD